MFKSIIFVAFFGLLVSCSEGSISTGDQVFRYNESGGISTLDPAFAREQSNIWAVHQIFNGLVQMDSALRIQPCLARSWTISDSGRLYSFRLRDRVLFHESTCFPDIPSRRLTSEDVVYSLERLRDPKVASPGSWVLQNVVEIRAVEDLVVEIRLREAFPPFLGLLTMKYCSVVSKRAMECVGKDPGRSPIGTGPFYLKAWIPDEKMVLRRNPDYFETLNGEQLPFLEAVAITFVPDKQSAFLEFLKGNNDLISGLDASYKDELLTRDGALKGKYKDQLLLQKIPYLNTEYLAFVVDDPHSIAHDPLIRKALNLCLDREAMIRYLRNGLGQPAEKGMIPRGLPAFDNEGKYGYSYDPEEASRLLDSAGYPSGKGLSPITLYTTSDYLDLCEFVQSQAAEIGIRVEVEVLPPAVFREKKAGAAMPFFRASWIADYPDAENYLSLFHSDNFTPAGPNYTHFSDPQFDRILELARVEPNDSVRDELYRKCDSIVMGQAPVMPLFYDEVVRFIRKDIRGMPPNPLNLLELKKVYFESNSSSTVTGK
ncbi:MAG: ABC transporter substrate-binding protein [Bacteroidota bacterium]|nr:ABC transporter substrate-binding protein [Bacteroidota bacterium]